MSLIIVYYLTLTVLTDKKDAQPLVMKIAALPVLFLSVSIIVLISTSQTVCLSYFSLLERYMIFCS